MFTLNFVLFLALVCGLSATDDCTEDISEEILDDLPILGGSDDLDDEEVHELHRKLTLSWAKLGEKNKGFDLIYKGITNGTSQIVAGTRYELNVKVETLKKEKKSCEAVIWEKLWENFFQIKLKCQDKHYSIDTTVP